MTDANAAAPPLNRFLLGIPIVLIVYAYAVWDGLQKTPGALRGFGFHPEAIAAMPDGLRWHLFGALAAIVLGAIQMAGVKGTVPHRIIGAVWAILMIAMSVAAILGAPRAGILQLVAVAVIVLTLNALWLAHRHNVSGHAQRMQMLFFAVLLGVGLFTAVPGRATWALFFSGAETSTLRH